MSRDLTKPGTSANCASIVALRLPSHVCRAAAAVFFPRESARREERLPPPRALQASAPREGKSNATWAVGAQPERTACTAAVPAPAEGAAAKAPKGDMMEALCCPITQASAKASVLAMSFCVLCDIVWRISRLFLCRDLVNVTHCGFPSTNAKFRGFEYYGGSGIDEGPGHCR